MTDMKFRNDKKGKMVSKRSHKKNINFKNFSFFIFSYRSIIGIFERIFNKIERRIN